MAFPSMSCGNQPYCSKLKDGLVVVARRGMLALQLHLIDLDVPNLQALWQMIHNRGGQNFICQDFVLQGIYVFT